MALEYVTPAQLSAAYTEIIALRAELGEVNAWRETTNRKLTALQAKLDALATAKPVLQTSTVDEDVAAADSVTRVHKALERELGVDRRTIYSRVERLVAAHELDKRIPDWQTNVEFARYLAARMPDGRVRLQHALESLEVGA